MLCDLGIYWLVYHVNKKTNTRNDCVLYSNQSLYIYYAEQYPHNNFICHQSTDRMLWRPYILYICFPCSADYGQFSFNFFMVIAVSSLERCVLAFFSVNITINTERILLTSALASQKRLYFRTEQTTSCDRFDVTLIPTSICYCLSPKLVEFNFKITESSGAF